MKTDANGAWEERGVIGTRVEIDGRRLTVLWRGGPVLETVFTARESGGCVELVPEKRGMRYAGAESDYARLVSLTLKGDGLIFTEDFPITGISEHTLRRTGNSRYGNCVPDNSLLPSLSGEWRSDDGIIAFTLDGDRLEMCGYTKKVCLLRYGNGRVELADADPANHELFGFTRLELRGDTLCGRMLICDATPPEVTFGRV